MDFDEAVKAGLIETMGDETDRRFMANVTAMINDKETVAKVADTFKLVYTPFHGCGYKLVDGNFPTVVSPNPENPEGFYLAIDLARENDVDFILGTDPDSDRVGIMIRDHSGEYRPVTGNQTGVLLLDYLIGAMRRSGKMPEKPAALKTIVTTEMARKVAESNGVTCYDTFTGFKFMAEKASPATTPSPASSSWRRRRTPWRPPARGRSSSPTRRATAICWGTTSGTRTPSLPPCC